MLMSIKQLGPLRNKASISGSKFSNYLKLTFTMKLLSKLRGMKDIRHQLLLFEVILMLNVLTNYIRRDFVSNTAHLIAFIPQLHTPQQLLHRGKLSKSQPSRTALQSLHHLGWTVPR